MSDKLGNVSKTRRWFSPFWRQCFVTGAVCIDVVGHGCLIGYPAVLLPQLEKNPTIPLTEDQASWIASVLGISMMIGIFMTAPVMGRLGRKIAHYTVILALLMAWLMFTLATSFTILLMGRILQGFSYGMFTTLRSTLIGEYTSPRNRGAFLTVISLAQGFGIGFVHIIGTFLSWQKTAIICSLFSFVSLLMTIYSPESPSWLADRGRYDKCREVFHWLRGDGEDEELEEMIQARLIEKKMKNKRLDSQKQSAIIELGRIIKKKEFYKPIVVMCHVNMMLSFCGSMTMAAFSTTIIGLVIGPKADANFWMVIYDSLRMVNNTIAIFVVNKTKRRTMLFATLGLNISAHIAIAGYLYARSSGFMQYESIWLPALLLGAQYFSIATGMVPLPGVIAGEIFPMAYRSIGGSISMASYAAYMFVVLKTFLGLVESVGLHGTYLVYTGVLTFALIVIGLLMPETKGKTLQQIEDEYKDVRLRPEDIEVTQHLQTDVSVTTLR